MLKKAVLLCVFSALIAAAFVPGANAEEQQTYWKFATLAPDGVGWAKQIKIHVLPAVEEVTDGSIKIKIYWGGVMGDDEDIIKKLRIGQLDGVGLSGQGVTLACKPMSVVELPFLFRSWEEVDYIKEKMRAQFDQLLADDGYMALAWNDQDFDQMYSTKSPLANLDDFRAAKFITWYGPVEEALLTNLGAYPVKVNVPEAATSVRQGIVDAAIAPAAFVVGSQLYAKIPYVNPIKVRYSPSLILLSMDVWEDLPDEYKEEFFKRRPDVEKKYCEAVRKDNEKSLAALIKYGLKETKMTEEDFAIVRERATAIWDELAGEEYPEEVLEEVKGHLADYRKAHSG
ncbi:TRAP transporter substrate-binding protein DctP [Desulfatibacillum aliphaticivorans]|uniref:TRAP transporter substrate-binding protein n=1 Tax=Desulfatibacillum aliphaticivorans TaxID=218208 RepID=UPI00040EB5EF|nr:TRAP transporter substrate-binding protein DctP [Desulfatibacillum aliphaticivorans]